MYNWVSLVFLPPPKYMPLGGLPTFSYPYVNVTHPEQSLKAYRNGLSVPRARNKCPRRTRRGFQVTVSPCCSMAQLITGPRVIEASETRGLANTKRQACPGPHNAPPIIPTTPQSPVSVIVCIALFCFSGCVAYFVSV